MGEQVIATAPVVALTVSLRFPVNLRDDESECGIVCVNCGRPTDVLKNPSAVLDITTTTELTIKLEIPVDGQCRERP